MPTNLRPNASTAKKDILRFSQSMVSNTTLRALELILSPCCDISITDVSQVCTGAGTSATTFTLSSIPNLIGQQQQATVYFSSSNAPGLTLVALNYVVGNKVTLNATLGTGVISIHIVFYLSIAGASLPILGATGGTGVAIATPVFRFTTITC